MKNNSMTLLEKIDYGCAGACGCAISLGKPIHALIYILASLTIAVIKWKKYKKTAQSDD